MLFQRNLLETITIVSCSGTFICILLNYITNISPITGIWLIIYLFSLFVASVFCSFKFIRCLLQRNEPIKYDVDSIIKKYSFLSFLSDILPQINRPKKSEPVKEYDTNELSVITAVLEKKLVSSWYVTYISEEIGFPFACKQMLDQMIAKTFQICNKIETKDVYVDVCAIFISHLTEYKKAMKRHEASPENSIEYLYKKTHPILLNDNKKLTSGDHCINILRIILKELVPWELWDTPYSELLVRILSKKLDTFVDTTIADPVWLNDKLLSILEKDKEKNDLSKVKDSEEPKPKCKTKDKVLEEPTKIHSNDQKNDIVQVQTNITEEQEIQNQTSQSDSDEPVEIKPTAVLRQKRGRQGRNEVKIYDRIIEGSVKTWETDMDLQCISVGQDLLASLDEMTISRLWGHEDVDHSPNLRVSPQPLWFGEEDTMDLEGEPKKESSPKPADALLKDLQTTVNNAKTKIGDLQVLEIDVNQQRDEAAGMMEGLLDKGIAGIKKGLRFTGLSDDSQEKSPVHKEKSERVSPSELYNSRPKHDAVIEAKESYVPITSHREETPGSTPVLIKQRNITSQDSTQLLKTKVEWEDPAELVSSSPEPQYEEVADLSASIAKLRSLLHHSAARGEEVWWEGAEETRGRAAGSHSSRPVDTAAAADEYDMTLERSSSPGQTSNNMQRLDKLFQRTVTGVFNSLKTAVGAEGSDTIEGEGEPSHWTYVATGSDLGVGGTAARAVLVRRALAQVDAALDSLRELPPAACRPPPPPLDLEEWCACAGARWSACACACAAAGLLPSHLAHTLATILFADISESLICNWLEDLTEWMKKEIFAYFEQLSSAPPAEDAREPLRTLCVEDTCKVIMQRIPETYLFSENTLSEAVKLVVGSFTHKQANKDVVFRTLDIFTAHFKKSAALWNPSFDNN